MQFAVSVHRECTAYLQFWFEDGKIQICLHLDSLKPMLHVFYLNCDYYYLSILLLVFSKGQNHVKSHNRNSYTGLGCRGCSLPSSPK